MFKSIWTDFTFYSGVSIVGFEPVSVGLVWINNFQECQTQSKFTIKTEKFEFISQLQWPVLLSRKVIVQKTFYSADIYMFNVTNRNTRTMCEIVSKLTIKTAEQFHSFHCWHWANNCRLGIDLFVPSSHITLTIDWFQHALQINWLVSM